MKVFPPMLLKISNFLFEARQDFKMTLLNLKILMNYFSSHEVLEFSNFKIRSIFFLKNIKITKSCFVQFKKLRKSLFHIR